MNKKNVFYHHKRIIHFIFECFNNELINAEDIAKFIFNYLKNDSVNRLYLIAFNFIYLQDKLKVLSTENYEMILKLIQDKISSLGVNNIDLEEIKPPIKDGKQFILSFAESSEMEVGEEISNYKFNFNIEEGDEKLFMYFTYHNRTKQILQNEDGESTLIFSSIVEDIIYGFEDNLELLINYLTGIEKFFGIKDGYSGEEAIIITIFNLILTTANSDNNCLLLTSILVKLTKADITYKKIISNVLNRILGKKGEILTKVEVESLNNFASFLSFYISNYSDILPDNWQNELSESNNLKVINFISIFFNKFSDLCKIERTSQLFSPNIYIPEEDKPRWKFAPNEPFYYDTEVIKDNIDNKKEYDTWTEKFESSGSEYIYVLCSCLFYPKHITLSHLISGLNFYKNCLKKEISSQERQITLLNALFDIWFHSRTYFKFIVQFLLNNDIIDHLVLVRFLISAKLNFEDGEGEDGKVEIKFVYKMWRICEIILEAVNLSQLAVNKCKTLMAYEQENLARSDEHSQAGIFKMIESYENYLEKMKEVNANILNDTMVSLLGNYQVLIKEGMKNEELSKIYEEYLMMIFRRNRNMFKDEDVLKVKQSINENFKESLDEKVTTLINTLLT
jgi:hypothetical protein